jgi:DTW domain-containing protein YfiP
VSTSDEAPVPGRVSAPVPGSGPGGRAECYRCHKPAVTCVCGALARVANRTPVLVVQHPREAFHPFGTVRFLRLGLERVEVVVAEPPDQPLSLVLPEGAALLYPGPGARILAPGVEPPSTLVLLDGTWPQVKALYRANPALRALPCYALELPTPSAYRIRREPKASYMATLEALVAALRAFEPDTPGLDGLIAAFTGMVETQLDYARAPVPRERRRRPRRAPLPESPVLAHAEFTHADRREFELVHLVAVRGSERLELIGRPERLALSPRLVEHLGLSSAQIEAGLSQAELGARWRAFVGDAPVLVWHSTVGRALDTLGGPEAQALQVKVAQHQRRRGGPARTGAVEDVVTREGLESRLAVDASTPRARCGLAALEAVWTWLSNVAAADPAT